MGTKKNESARPNTGRVKKKKDREVIRLVDGPVAVPRGVKLFFGPIYAIRPDGVGGNDDEPVSTYTRENCADGGCDDDSEES